LKVICCQFFLHFVKKAGYESEKIKIILSQTKGGYVARLENPERNLPEVGFSQSFPAGKGRCKKQYCKFSWLKTGLFQRLESLLFLVIFFFTISSSFPLTPLTLNS